MSYDEKNKRLFIGDRNSNDPKGITLMEISRCLQDYRRDKNGNIDLGMMCTSPRINPWAKNKPTPVSGRGTPYIGMLTYEQRKDANFGLNIPTASSPLEIKENYYDAQESPKRNGWTHKVPDPYYNEYYRVTDFDGYAHNAICPFGRPSIPNQAINMEGSDFLAMITITTGGGADSEFISQSELPSISEKYFALQLRERNGDTIRTALADKTLGEGGGDITMSTFNLPDGEYDAIPFISPNIFEGQDYQEGYIEGELGFNVEYHPLPLGFASVITIRDRYYTVIIEAWKDTTSDGEPAIKYSFSITNHTADTIELTNNSVEAKLFGHSADAPLMDGEKRQAISRILILANQTYTRRDQAITGISQEVYDNPILYFFFNDGETVMNIMPLASAGDREIFG